jgi:hypothetical protein
MMCQYYTVAHTNPTHASVASAQPPQTAVNFCVKSGHQHVTTMRGQCLCVCSMHFILSPTLAATYKAVDVASDSVAENHPIASKTGHGPSTNLANLYKPPCLGWHSLSQSTQPPNHMARVSACIWREFCPLSGTYWEFQIHFWIA